jgi:hypothetical protein
MGWRAKKCRKQQGKALMPVSQLFHPESVEVLRTSVHTVADFAQRWVNLEML